MFLTCVNFIIGDVESFSSPVTKILEYCLKVDMYKVLVSVLQLWFQIFWTMGTKFSTCDLKVGDVRTFNARDICEIYFERFLLPIANTLKCYLKIWYIQTFEHIIWKFFYYACTGWHGTWKLDM